jgi:tetratricopeptide (TPR) repeat protein
MGEIMSNVLKEGITLYRSSKYEDALAFFLSVPSDNSISSIDLAYYIGLCYARMQKYDEALLYLEQVITGGDENDRMNQCRLILSVIYSLTGRTRLADFELKKLLEGGYQTEAVFCALAYVAWVQKKSDAAVSYYEKALDINSEYPTALNGLGYVLACSGKDLTKALSLCKKAYDFDHECPAFLDSMGWVYYQLGLLKEAKQYSKRAKDKDSSNPEIIEHYRLIHSQQSLQKDENGSSARGTGRGGVR